MVLGRVVASAGRRGVQEGPWTRRWKQAGATQRRRSAAGSRTARWRAESASEGAEGASAQGVDGIVVLAGGLTASGGVPRWVQGRLDAASELHAKYPGSVILVTGGGSPHKRPVLFDSGHVNHESTVCCDYLVKERGVCPTKIIKETSSYDTIGNAYFSLVIHALPLGWRSVVAVTSAFHLPRAAACFDWVYGSCDSSPALRYHSVPDEGMSPRALEARIGREKESAQALVRNAREILTLKEINLWLHQKHRCYAVARQEEWNEPTEADKLELETY